MGGSQLPKLPSGAVWKAGSTVEAKWSIRANHGGGWQYRLCPLKSNLTEACFQETPVPFADDSSLMLANGTKIKLKSTFVSEGTLPAGSTWQMNPVPLPDTHSRLSVEGRCSGEWLTNITFYDQLRV